MRFFIDTANCEQIKDAFDLGIVSGVTTNPTIISKEGKDFETTIKDITAILGDEGTIFAEVTALDAEGMIKEGREIAKLHKSVVVKIPMIKEGIKAVNALSKEGISTCVTLIFSAPQALVAALAGADYVAPFMGRVDDIGWDGLQLVDEISDMFFAQDIDTQIVAASTRHAGHVVEATKMGADIVTMPYPVMMKLLNNPSTDACLTQFLKDWEKVPK